MKRISIIFTVIVLVWLVGDYMYDRNWGVQNIEFVKLEEIKFKKVIPFPKLSLVSSANIILKNPNLIGAEVTGVDFDVYVEDKHTTRVNHATNFPVAGNEEFNVPLEFEIPLGKAGFFKDVKDILTGAWKNQTLTIRTVGSINIRFPSLKIDFNLPFDESMEYLLKDYLPK